ncbi:hypothetical protein WA026_021045 [Henosepilachna vigintioctopunctata]|uniref:Ribosomal protein S3 n=1 Tax=Henosepilachna vigintioctopunctata TaxID=420089 RepID=A0AAW1V1I0_9CUCU
MPLKTSLRKKINYASLKSNLASYDWNLVYNSKAGQDATTKFLNVINEQILANTTVSVLKNRNIGRNVWITQGRSLLQDLIKKTKIQYYKSLITPNTTNSKDLWKIVNKITNSKLGNKEIKEIRQDDSTIIHSKKDIAESFNRYFSDVAPVLSKQIKTRSPRLPGKKRIVGESIFLGPTNCYI